MTFETKLNSEYGLVYLTDEEIREARAIIGIYCGHNRKALPHFVRSVLLQIVQQYRTTGKLIEWPVRFAESRLDPEDYYERSLSKLALMA